MITPDYVRTMARYNRWQNQWVMAAVADLGEAEAQADRGGFFGSILGTLNHLLWGDTIWMARFDGGAGVPAGMGIPQSPGFCADTAAWAEARPKMDARITAWADGLDADRLTGDLAWYSGALGQDVSKPLALCVTHFINHQTHHRGQVHAMITAAGGTTGDTDLFIMPDTA